MARLLTLLIVGLLMASSARAADTCGVDSPCDILGSTYRVSPPPKGAPTMAALFLHGYGGSGDDMMADKAFRLLFARAGILLILPNGPGKTWAMPGAPGDQRDDRSFINVVVDDVTRRWGIDRQHMWVAGMSQGAAMVWDLACHVGGFSAYVAVAGDFWGTPPARCEAGPASLLQIHGWTDATFPLEGRAIDHAQQGDVFASLAALRRVDGCRSNPDEMIRRKIFFVRTWTSCTSGATIRFLLHPGGHELPAGWFDESLAFVRGVTAAAQ